MKTGKLCVFAFPLIAVALLAQTAPAPPGHVVVTPDQIKWGPAPPSLPPGAQAAVLSGDPSHAGVPYTIRFKAPDGYRVPPHWHPVDENIIVIQGAFMIGIGEKFNRSAAHTLTAGAYTRMPKEIRHFASVKGETIFDVYGVGPFEITYVNPADDPRKKAPAKK